jgi:hypothetical protein
MMSVPIISSFFFSFHLFPKVGRILRVLKNSIIISDLLLELATFTLVNSVKIVYKKMKLSTQHGALGWSMGLIREGEFVPQTAQVVIIGAGVIGCSTAYHLARMGITDIAVVEMGQVGSGSSGKSASMLSLQFCHDEMSVRMAKYSYGKYMQFEEEIGVPTDF